MIQRFVDYIPLAIEHELNQTFSDNIRNTLIQTLSEDSQNGRIDLTDLLNEDPITAARRVNLDIKISRLQKIMAELDRFEHLESPEVQDIKANGRSTSPSTICDRPRSLSRSCSPPHTYRRRGGVPGSGEPTEYLQRTFRDASLGRTDSDVY